MARSSTRSSPALRNRRSSARREVAGAIQPVRIQRRAATVAATDSAASTASWQERVCALLILIALFGIGQGLIR